MIYHDTLVSIMSDELVEDLNNGSVVDIESTFEGTAKLLIGRVIGRKVKKYRMLIEILDLEGYKTLRRNWN